MKRIFFFLIIFFNLSSLKSEEIANSIDKFCNEEFPYSWKHLRLVKQKENV